jgi:phenylalanyl-tRNA synthetase beta chain
MKFTVSWLKEYLETDATLDQISETLTAIGLEVEEIDNPAETFAPFKVALIEKAEQHPNADRLKVCTVDTGEEKVQVVCGAPNARTGMKGVFAPTGSYIPGLDVVLKKGNIRGEDSHGMMVSEKEMMLSDEHKGIIEVDDSLELGTPMADVFGLNDPVIEIALTPNRPDCAGIYGIARDLAAAGLGTLKTLDGQDIKGTFKSDIDVKIEDEQACPLFIGRYIKGVKNGPSPDWLQQRLKSVGLRPISALVDVTNYFSIGLCRPLHVFDADKLKGDVSIRLSKEGETLAALDENTYTLDDQMTVVCDDSGPIALGGVMGGMESGCTDDTVNVYLEVAYFSPERTAKTGRALQIQSDARYRFERGIDPDFTVPATDLATQMILDLCGGEVSEPVVAGKVPAASAAIQYDTAMLEKYTGVDLAADKQKEILETLGFAVDGNWSVQAPSWRPDVHGKPDIVEEIIRIHGYDKVEAVSFKKDTPLTQSAATPMLNKVRKARAALAGSGMHETVTWSFMPSSIAKAFANENTQTEALTLLNPISSDLDMMRPSILGNLVQAARENTDKGYPNCALFEVGPIFHSAKADGQQIVATGLRSGQCGNRHWSSSEAHRSVDAYDAKADALNALRACDAPADNAQVSTDAPDYYHPGRSGSLRLGKNILAYFGEIHPAILQELDVKGPVVGFECFLGNIPASKKKTTAKTLPDIVNLQPITKDFAFVVDETVKADELIRAAKGADRKLITSAEIFDVYSGKGMEDGKKSLALSVVLQPRDKTLTDQDIDALMNKVVTAVTDKTGGVLRG